VATHIGIVTRHHVGDSARIVQVSCEDTLKVKTASEKRRRISGDAKAQAPQATAAAAYWLVLQAESKLRKLF
jgi:hypothetical protein